MDSQYSIYIQSDEDYYNAMQIAVNNGYKWIGNVEPLDYKPHEERYYINIYDNNMDLTTDGIEPIFDVVDI